MHTLCKSLLGAVTLLAASIASAQTPTSFVNGFGPQRSQASFFGLTRGHTYSVSGNAVTADKRGRLLLLSAWRDSENDTDVDCAVTRYLSQARMLDMSFGGATLEATAKVPINIGASNIDVCTSIAADPFNRPIIAGSTFGVNGERAFIARLNASGDLDSTFGSNNDGKLVLSQGPFFTASRINDVTTLSDGRLLACGYVQRGTERNMLIVKVNLAGELDTSFNVVGYREVDFDGGGDDFDSCSRLLVLPNNKILLGGTARNASGELAFAIARLNPSGSSDTGFSTDGRLRIDHGSLLSLNPNFADIAYDPARSRILAVGNLASGGAPFSGYLMAITDSGFFDTSFFTNGRRGITFSSLNTSPGRSAGLTSLKRVLMNDDGSFHLVGTHYNADGADTIAFGNSDTAVATLLANGNETGLTQGVFITAPSGRRHANVDSLNRNKVADVVKDAIFYRGQIVVLSDVSRYPAGSYDTDFNGVNEQLELGPNAPVLTALRGQSLFADDFEYDGLPEPTNIFQSIAVPSGYGRYCSVINTANSANFGFLPNSSPVSDPCDDLGVGSNSNLVIKRSGLFSNNGTNNVLAHCDGNYFATHVGIGIAPLSAAFSGTSGRRNCVFTVAPAALPIFDRPYFGAHLVNAYSSFNHTPYNVGISVSEFGQIPLANHPLAHNIDLYGRQNCNATGSGNEFVGPLDVDEPAVDISLPVTRNIHATAAGRVASAVPRNVTAFTPVGGDPWQREVAIRHSVGTGRYSEVFTTYYAHMTGTSVRRGEVVTAGDILGRVGTTGASYGVHLHISVIRNRNLSYRQFYEHGYEQSSFDIGKTVSVMSPWGWRAPAGTDPWASRFLNYDESGSWSINLWKAGEEPTMPD